MMAYCYLSVSLNRQLVEAVALAEPSGNATELVDSYLLPVAVAREDVVESEGFVLEILVEILCLRCDYEDEQREQSY